MCFHQARSTRREMKKISGALKNSRGVLCAMAHGDDWDAGSCAFLVRVCKFVGDQLGRNVEARLIELLGEPAYRQEVRRRRRNDLIRELDNQCGGSSINQRAKAVDAALSIGAVPLAADVPGDPRRSLSREILLLTRGKVPSDRTLRYILAGADSEDPE